jgi:protein TonB
MSQGPTGFVADAAWRLDAPPRRRERIRMGAAILAALAIELGVFALIWTERGLRPAPKLEEIPVEIVVEKPKPPPSPAPQAQPQPKPDLMEKEATDAPREGKSDHDDEHVAEKEKPAKAPPPPSPPQPSPEPPKPAPAPAPEMPKEAEAESPPPEKTPPVEKPAPAKLTAADVLPKVFDSVPDVDFGGAAMHAPVSGGMARATYLSILLGMTKAHLRIPESVRGYAHPLVGVIEVTLGGDGRLLQRYIVQSSGSPELDEAEMQAVAEASRHFPAPPNHASVGLRYTYTKD